MQSPWNDLRRALRYLGKSPGYTLTAVLTLSLGIGANTAVFTLVHAVMLNSLPVADPQQLYQIGDNDIGGNWGGFQGDWALYSYDFFRYMRDNTPAFEDVAAFQSALPTMSVRRSNSSGPAQPLGGEFVSGNYFSTFGIQSFRGRILTENDDTPSAAPVAVMTYRAWAEKFGQDPSVLGGAFQVNGKTITVVGVTPPGFYGDRLQRNPPDFFIPLNQEPNLSAPGFSLLHMPDEFWLYAIGRMKPGQNRAQVGAQLTVELQHWLAGHVPMIGDRKQILPKQHIALKPGGAGITRMRNTFQRGLLLLTATAALVLLIACANLANLQLVRGMSRKRQVALQLALGATRRRLIRGMLGESVLLSLIGGAVGIVIAYFSARGILLVLFRGASFVPIDAEPSLAILGFAFALSLLTGLLFGIVPALVTSRSNPIEDLRGTGHTAGNTAAFPQKSFVVFQAAFSLVLLASAGLFTESLRHLEGSDFGFQAEGRLVVGINPQSAGYRLDQLPLLYQRMGERLLEIPGVRYVSFSTFSPQDGDRWNNSIALQGHPDANRTSKVADWVRISPHYFEAIGTPLLRGRTIDEQDTANSVHVAVVDEAFAKRYFPNEDPLGKHFGVGVPGHSGDFTIVGVVKTARYQHAMAGQNPMYFVPLTQSEAFTGYELMQHWEDNSHYIHKIEFRVAGDPTQYSGAIRNAIASSDPNLSIIEMESLGEQVVRMYDQERLTARLTGLFGLLALLLASMGIYGVTAYLVGGKTHEIGIRMALGADRSNVLGMVLRGALIQLGIGLAIGFPLTILVGRLLRSQLYEVREFDSSVVLSSVMALVISASLAGLLPARRAASIDPIEALRIE